MVKNKWFQQTVAVMRFFETGIIVVVVGYLGYVVGRMQGNRMIDFMEREMIIKKTCIDVSSLEAKMLLRMKIPTGQYSVCANLLFPKEKK